MITEMVSAYDFSRSFGPKRKNYQDPNETKENHQGSLLVLSFDSVSLLSSSGSAAFRLSMSRVIGGKIEKKEVLSVVDRPIRVGEGSKNRGTSLIKGSCCRVIFEIESEGVSQVVLWIWGSNMFVSARDVAPSLAPQ